MEHTIIEVKNLELSPDNARRTITTAALEEMVASILSHGLMHNLVVTDAGSGRFRVIAGGRRLAALQRLQEEGKLPAGHTVPCQVVSDELAFELSLAENTVRQAMHPADEYEAFARLAENGDTAEAIANRFGVPERHVLQRFKLGHAAPELLDAYRDEALTLDCLMAFTITDDHAKQLEVYQSLKPWQVADPRQIRALLTGEMLEASSKLVKFVGLDAYHAKGGVSRGDLFGDAVYLESPNLLHRLVAEKLDAARQQLEAEGWKWVQASPDRDWDVVNGCQRIHPRPVAAPQELLDQQEQLEAEIEALNAALEDTESDELIDALDDAQARLAKIEEQLETFVTYDPRDMQCAGAFVSIASDGTLEVEKGLVLKADLKALTADGDYHPRKAKTMPDSLRRDLESYRLQAAQVEIATHRLVALDLLAFTLARDVLARRPVDDGVDLHLVQHSPTRTVQNEQTRAASALEALFERLPRGWMEHDSDAEQFQAFLALSEHDKLDFLAYGVALSLRPQLSDEGEDSACELALSLTDGDVTRYWRPTRANYLGRITRDQLLALGRDLLGDPWADARNRDKKGDVADSLERAFAEPEKHARSPERAEALKRWLPVGMAFDAGAPLSPDIGHRAAA